MLVLWPLTEVSVCPPERPLRARDDKGELDIGGPLNVVPQRVEQLLLGFIVLMVDRLGLARLGIQACDEVVD